MPWTWSIFRGRLRRLFRRLPSRSELRLGRDWERLEERIAPAADPFRSLHAVVADFTGDGIPDLATSAPGRPVQVFDGANGNSILTIAPFGSGFTGEVSLAAADVTGDGRTDLIVGAGFTGGPRVLILDGTTGGLARSFFAFDPEFRGGVSVAAGDVTGDGRADIIVGAGYGGGPHVRVFDGASGNDIRDWFAYQEDFIGGVTVATADLDGAGLADIVTGAGPGGGPHVRAFSGRDGSVIRNYFSSDPAIQDGVVVAAGDVDGNGLGDILAVGRGRVQVFAGRNESPFLSIARPTGASAVVGDLDGDGFGEVLIGSASDIVAFGGAGLGATGFAWSPGAVLSGFAKAPPTAPLAAFSGEAIFVPGAGNVDVTFYRLRAYTSRGDEVGLFPVDDASGRIGTRMPGDDGYLDAAFAAKTKAIATTGLERGIATVAGGRFHGLYLSASGERYVSFAAANAGGIPQFRHLPRNRFAADDAPRAGFGEYHAIVGEITIGGSTSPPPPVPGGGNFTPDLAGWTRTDVGGSNSGHGIVTVTDGVARLVEGDSFRVGLAKSFTVPATPTAVQITFDSPSFDTTSTGMIRDAFEIAVLAADDSPLALPTGPGRDASFNWSEGLAPVFAPGTTGGTTTASINLSALPEGTAARIVLRLVNNDSDNATTVNVRRVDFIAPAGSAPSGSAPAPARSSALAAVEIATLEDVTPSVRAEYGATTLTEERTILTADLSLRNTGTYPVVGRLLLALGNISDASVGVMNPDGFTPDGRPFFDLSANLVNGALRPGEATTPRTIQFTNPGRERFTYDLTVLGGLAHSPYFTSTPVALVEAGASYTYPAAATAPDGEPLTFSLVGGPIGMTVDPVTGVVAWPTTLADVGSAAVRLRVSDPLGGMDEQNFTITVESEIPNRPPVFTSTPPTDAVIAAPFEVQTYATGTGPVAVTAGIFGSGVSIVSANPGDATLGFIGSDRVSRPLSVGEPHPSNFKTSFVAPLPVDLGFAPNSYTNNERSVGVVQTADVNGDGNPDLLVTADTGSSNYFDPANVGHIGVRLGNGDGTFRRGWEATAPLVAGRGSAFSGLRYQDVTRDGIADLVTAQYLGRTVVVYRGLAGGTFADAPIVSAYGGSSSFLQMADLNGDGTPDVVLFENNPNGQFRRGLSVLLGNGDGSFGPETYYAATNDNGGPGYIVDADGVNGPDLVRLNYTDQRLEVRLNDGTGRFGDALFSGVYALGNNGLNPAAQFYSQPITGTFADFDGDGVVDASVTVSTYGIYFLKGLGNGYFGDNTFAGNKSNTPIFTPTGLNTFPASYQSDGTASDLNGDGKPDVAIGDGQYGFLAIGIGRGDGTFDLSSYNVQFVDDIGSGSRGNQLTNQVNIADYNRDGVIDVAIVSGRDGNRPGGIAIVLGDQPGTMRAAGTVPFGERQFGSIVVGDFNNDGFPDIASHDGQGIIVADGRGDGTFEDYRHGLNGGAAEIHSLIAADFDGDGNLDLAWQGFTGLNVIPTYYQAFGLGNGAFQLAPSVFPPQPANAGRSTDAQEVVAGDFNGDGHPDLAYRVTDAQGSGDGNGGFFTRVDVLLYNPAGRRFDLIADPTHILGPLNVIPAFYIDEPVGFADLNGDGKAELFAHAAAVKGYPDRPDTPERLYIWEPALDAAATNASQLFTLTIVNDPHLNGGERNTIIGFAIADFDRDGRPDFAAATAGVTVVSYGNGDFTYRDQTVYLTNNRGVRAGDVNGDGIVDLVTNWTSFGNFSQRPLTSAMLGRPDGTFDEPELLGAVVGGALVAVGDFNLDGRTDFTAASSGHYSETFLAAPPGLAAVQSGDIDGDGTLDLVGITTAFNRVKVLLGNGDNTFTRVNDLLVGQAPVDLRLADLDGDGRLDIVTANRIGKSITVLHNADGTFSRTDFALPARPSRLAVSDVTGDGRPDVAAISETGHTLSMLINSPTGLQDATALDLGFAPGGIALSDVTVDGIADAVLSDPVNGRVFVLPGLGNGGFGGATIIPLERSPDAVSLADMNFDGKLDIIVTLPDGGRVGVLFNRGGGRFTTPQTIRVGDSPNSLIVHDANADGKPDLLVTNSDNTLSIILNRFDPNNLYRYAATAIDPDGDPIAFDLDAAPGGMLIDEATGQILWAPMPDQIGRNDVVVSVRDNRGGSATQGFAIAVTSPTTTPPPAFTSQPVTAIPIDGVYTYEPSTTNPGDNPLRYRLVDGPDGLTVDPTTGAVRWDPRHQGLSLGLFRTDTQTPRFVNRGDVRSPDSPSLRSPSVTAEGWFKFDSVAGVVNGLIRKSIYTGFNGQTASWQLDNSGGSLHLRIGNVGTFFDAYASTALPAGQWTHLAFTFDGATNAFVLYVGGSAVLSGVSTLPISYDDNPLIVGQNLLGSMTGIRVWDRALSASELAAGMNAEVPNDSPGLVLDYDFSGGPAASSVLDRSPLANHGGINTTFNPYNYPPHIPALAFAGTHPVTIQVEDGQGGVATQTFAIDLVPLLRAAVQGRVFDSVSDVGLEGWAIYVDGNRNNVRDSGEAFAVTNAAGNYTLGGLLAGTSPLAIEARAGYASPAESDSVLSAGGISSNDFAVTPAAGGVIRGRVVRDGSSQAIPGFAAYVDANANGVRDAGEAFGLTDRLGDFALSGLEAGSYAVRVDLPAGWSAAAPSSGVRSVILAADGTSLRNDFTLNATAEAASTPVFVSAAPPAAVARSQYRYAAVAIDPLGRPLTYSLLVGPANMAIHRSTGVIVWTPSTGDVGAVRILIRATNETGGMAIQDFTAAVTAANTAPIVTSAATATASADELFRFDALAQDAEQSGLRFVLESAPSGMAIDESTGRITWIPTPAQVGARSAVVVVRDGVGGETRQTIAITVQASDSNADPAFERAPRSTAQVGRVYIGQVSASDPDGDALSYSLVSGPAGLTITGSGRLNWTPSADQFGANSLRIRVEDGRGGSDERDYTIEVESTNANRPPALMSPGSSFAVMNGLFTITLAATDPDRDALAFQLIGGPAGLSIDGTRGTVAWRPTSDQLGVHTVAVRVLDPFGGAAEASFTIAVRGAGGPPAILSTPPTTAAVGQTFVYSVAARDFDNDPLTFALSAAPAGMTIDALTGVVSWSPVAEQVGTQPVIVRVSDGAGGFTTQAFSIVVSAGTPNRPPVTTTLPPLDAEVGVPFAYTLEAVDPEDGTLSYAVRSGPVGFTIEPHSGLVTWTPTAAQLGTGVVVLTASDPEGGTAVQSFLLTVHAANNAPAIVSVAPASVPQGGVFRYDLRATDADREPLSYELTDGPAGMTIDSLGRVKWPTALDTPLGPRSATFLVRDGRGGSVSQLIDFNVVADTTPPRITILVANGLLYPWSTEPARVRVTATDDVGVTSIRLTVDGVPVALAPDGTATVYFSAPGNGRLRAFATDAAGNEGRGFGQVSMRSGAEDGLSSTPITTNITSLADGDQVQGLVTILGTAAAEDLTDYVLSYRRASEETFHEIGRGTTSVTDGVLGVWDTTLLENDQYVLQLQANDAFGGFRSTERAVGLVGDLKLGNFRLSFTDITIPVAGIPITLARTYDSLRAAQDGELGYGWSLEFRNTNLRTSLPKSELEDLGIYTAFKPGTKVYLTLPGGAREGFTFTPDIRALPGFGNSLVIATPRFTPDRGVTDVLTVRGGTFIVNEYGELMGGGGQPYNPAAEEFGGGFTVNTSEGIRYRIDGNSGLLTAATDRNGNELLFTDNGISGRGVSLTFERDARGRITRATDPASNSVQYAYDSKGNLSTVTDRSGNTTRFGYKTSPAHYLETVTDPLGRTGIRAVYGADGRLTGTLDARGNGPTVSYDPANNVVITRDALGQPTLTEYDEFGNVVAVTDPLGAVTRTEYDANGLPIAVTDPLGRTTRSRYDAFGNEIATIDPLGRVTSRTFTALGDILSQTDALGHTIRNEFDATGNLIGQTDALGHRASATYSIGGALTGILGFDDSSLLVDSSGGRLNSVSIGAIGTIRVTHDAAGFPTLFESTAQGGARLAITRDQNGRPLSQTDATGAIDQFEYDAAGNLVRSTDSLGRITRYEVDAANNLARTIFPDGASEIRTYDEMNRLQTVTDRGGRTTSYMYDAAGRIIETVYPDGTADPGDNPRTRIVYDLAGQVVSEIDELGRVTSYAYDGAGNRIRATDALGASTRSEFDAVNRLVRVIDPVGLDTSYVYDAGGNNSEVIHADGLVDTATFDERGRIASTTNPAGETTRFRYDAQGLLVAVVDPLGGTTVYGRDADGRLLTITDALGRVTRFEYDGAGRTTARILPSGERETTTYDLAGEPITTTDFSGRTTRFDYDSNGRIIRASHPDGRITETTWTPAGKVASVREGAAITQYDYDARDRLISKTDPYGQVVSYEYDAVGNVTTLRSAGGMTVYSYDALDRPLTVSGTEGVIRYTYDAAGRLLSTVFPNQTTETRDYDSRSRVVLQSVLGPSGVLDSRSTTFDRAGRRTMVADATGRIESYEYDANGRLTHVEMMGPAGSVRRTDFTYDAVGNRTLRHDSLDGDATYAYDARDRLLSETTTGATVLSTYDAEGNLLARGSDPNNRLVNTWDAAGRLVETLVVSAGGSTTVGYAYSPDGERYSRTQDGETTRFLVDSRRENSVVLAELTDGVFTASYLRQAEGTGLLAQTVNGITSVLHATELGSIRMATDTDGAPTDRIVYDAFGAIVQRTGTTSLAGLFNGESRDPVTGLDYLRARYYDPATGRFISSDPFSGFLIVPNTLNKYVYAQNDPLNMNDPSGRFSLTEQQVNLAIVATFTTIGVGYGYVRAKATGQSVVSNVLFYGLAGFGIGVTSVVLGGGTLVTQVTTRLSVGQTSYAITSANLSRAVVTAGYTSVSYVSANYLEFITANAAKGIAFTIIGFVLDVLFYGGASLNAANQKALDTAAK